MNIRALWVLILFLIGAAGCDRPGAAWDEAREADSVEAYRQFVEAYPDSPQAGDAEQRILELRREQAWEAARMEDTVESYQAFLGQYPEGEFADQARSRLSVLERQSAWQALEDSDDLEALSAFADDYRETPEAAEAQARIAEIQAARQEAESRERARAEEERRRLEAEQAARSHRVQLAALRTAEQAREGAQRLREQLGDMLAETDIEVHPSGNLHLLRTEPMEEDAAAELCERLKASGNDCLVVPR